MFFGISNTSFVYFFVWKKNKNRKNVCLQTLLVRMWNWMGLWQFMSRASYAELVEVVRIVSWAKPDGALTEDTQSPTSDFEKGCFETVDMAESRREVDHFNGEAALIQNVNSENYTAVRILPQLRRQQSRRTGCVQWGGTIRRETKPRFRLHRYRFTIGVLTYKRVGRWTRT